MSQLLHHNSASAYNQLFLQGALIVFGAVEFRWQSVYCHPAYLTYMQSTSWETLGWRKHKLESRLLGEILITSDMQMTPLYGRKWRGAEESLDEGDEREWKIWLKTQHSKNEDYGILSHHFIANRWGNNGNSERLYFFGLQNHCRRWLQPWN